MIIGSSITAIDSVSHQRECFMQGYNVASAKGWPDYADSICVQCKRADVSRYLNLSVCTVSFEKTPKITMTLDVETDSIAGI